MFEVTKTYGAERGLSCAFRQWRAESHCRFIHGYALAFEFTFACVTLDERNWVVDFGSLKPLEAKLKEMFDHRLLVAADDPELEFFRELNARGLAQVTVVRHTGCEAFAMIGYTLATDVLQDSRAPSDTRLVRCTKVRVWEHPANSASWVSPLGVF